MTPKERHAADASLQAAALRHYAVMCRNKADAIARGTDRPNIPECDVTWLLGKAERADTLANAYERLEVAALS